MAPGANGVTEIDVNVREALGDGIEITAANITEYNGKIAEVTGLNVTDAVNEAAYGGTAPGAGLRLSLSGKATEGKGRQLQIGDTADSFNQPRVSIGDMHTQALGIAGLNIGTAEDAAAIDTIKNAINQVSSVRGDLGAYQNRLEHTQNNLSVMAENIQDADSSIRDTDVAEEMMSYVKNNILVQSGY